MDITKMGGSKAYVKYLAIASKNYINVPIKNTDKLYFGHGSEGGAGTWGNDLFHYCTIDTLKKIMQKDKEENIGARLRFTDVRFLNDTTEFTEAVRLLKTTIKKKEDIIDKELYNILIDEKIYDELEKEFQRYPFRRGQVDKKDIMDCINPICRVYTCSFSMECDLLPMWNYYAQGAGGVSINFNRLKDYIKVNGEENDKNEIINSFSGEIKYNHEQGVESIDINLKILIDHTKEDDKSKKGEKVKLLWGKVWYTEEDKKKCIEALLEDIVELFSMIPDEVYRKEMIQTAVVSAINNMRIFMKNENFSTEKEYRAVLIVPEDSIRNNQLPKRYKCGHFDRGNIITPYVDVPFAPECIESIVVGSGVVGDFSLIKLGLKDWLLQQGLTDIEIYRSNVPIRKY